jgi:hypothetical protein
MLRTNPSEYERVYAESSEMERQGSQNARRYLLGVDIVDVLQQQLDAAGIDHDPIDTDDVYSKFEAAPPEWFQVPH